MWASPSVRRRRASETKLLVHNVFWAKDEEGKFHTVFGRLKDTGQNIIKYFRMGMSTF